MKSIISLFNRKYYDHNGLVLMYHKIAEPVSDVWEISVSRKNFIQHLQFLKKYRNVISLKEMIHQYTHQKIKKNTIAITFDDGSADNFLVAKPLLEEYRLPATFFITSCNIGRQEPEFWWDELENILLFTNQLPQNYSGLINEKLFEFNLQNEIILTEHLKQIHNSWKACLSTPPTLRCKLFFQIWEALKPLPHKEQQIVLGHIKKWAQIKSTVRSEYTCMSVEQLQQLGNNSLFQIAVHTATHPALAFHDYHFQKKEISENKNFLEEITGHKIGILSYPYGNYNNTTIDAVIDSGFDNAFTTEEKPVTKNSNQFRLGRYQVKNWESKVFQLQLKKWVTAK